MSKVYTSIDQLIGHTPLLELAHFEADEDLKARVLVKLEYFNPAGSVKDRVAKNMIDEAEKAGKLVRGGDYTIIEPTSGNTGVGIASVAAARGYKVIITMPETMSVERRKLMQAYGAQLVLTDGSKGMKGAIAKAEELQKDSQQHHRRPVCEPRQPRHSQGHNRPRDLGRHRRQGRHLRRRRWHRWYRDRRGRVPQGAEPRD